MNKKTDEYIKKAKKINRTIIILAISIFLLGVLISIVYYVMNKKEPIDEIQMSSNGEETETFTNDLGEPLLNPGKGLVLRGIINNNYDNVVNIGYYRFYWKDIEPQEGFYNWEEIDSKIEDYASRGKKFAFGVSCASSSVNEEYVTPKWVFDAGAKSYIAQISETRIQIIPNWTDQIFLEKLNNFVKALGEKYDGNKNIAYIDIRSYGNFGEQHLGVIGGQEITSEQLKELYIKPYMKVFQKTRLVTPWGGDTNNVTYTWCIDNGVSVRRDGIMVGTKGKSTFEYAYGKVPTIFEYYYHYNSLKYRGLWSEEKLLDYIETWHPSYTEFFPEMYDDSPDFCKYIANKIGYYFKFKSSTYKNTVTALEEAPITLNFTNEGVAPLYEPCTLYIGLLDKNYQLVKKYKTDIDPHTWMPNEEINEQLDLRLDGVDDGEYIISLGLFYNEQDTKPTYLLGNTGKTDDNWYVFGKINITNPKEEYNIDIYNKEKIVNLENYNISIKANNLRTDKNYRVKVFINNELKQSELLESKIPTYSKDFTLNLEKGKNIYKIIIERNNETVYEFSNEVYMNNCGTNYITISNNLTKKYNEFSQQFGQQISQILDIQQLIQNLKKESQKLATKTELEESEATSLMEAHYNLGMALIKKYKEEKIEKNYIILNSMLKEIAEIGNYYENLVAINSNMQRHNLSHVAEEINRTQIFINNNEDLGMVYPKEILEIGKNVYNEANEINQIDTTNHIKIGLLESKSMHSIIISDLAKEFANLYIDDYITNNPVQITYTTTNPTNQNVTATLETNANITITNNSNSKTHTFEQNGSFTFEYEIKGQAFKKTAEVNNIDKKAPEITGVQNDRLYIQNITPKIQDENLQEVLLYKDNILSQAYKTNTTISEEGSYRLVAKDRAGNQTTVEFDICKNPATIKYSTTELTNQDVIVTIESKYPIEETNNSNKTSYTFTENGEFTFKFKIKGAELELNANVGNIDKKAPTITGAQNGKLYIDKVTPIITDENLKDAKLYLNSHEVENYTSGMELTEEGFYKIIATDNAGNETTIEFAIMESMEGEYKIQENYILNIKNNTNKSDFDKNLKMPIKYEIFRGDNKLTENDKIATGDILTTDGGDKYTLIVNGDMNKDGEVNIKDIIKLRKYLLERNNIDEISLLAADCNLDGKSINIKDLIKMRLIVLQRDVT